jgi:hypothetical protein
VGVFHGCFAIGEPAPRPSIDDAFSVWGPERLVLVIFRGGEAANAVVRDTQSEEVVVEKLILIRLAIRSEENLFAVGLPVNGLLIGIA